MNAKLGRLRGSTEANIGEPWNGQELSANERDATRTGQNVRALSASVRLPYSMTHLTSTPRRHVRSRPLQTALGHSRTFFPRPSHQPVRPSCHIRPRHLCVDRHARPPSSPGPRPPAHPPLLDVHPGPYSRGTVSDCCRSPVSQLRQHMVY